MMTNTTTPEMPLSLLLVEQDLNWGRFLQAYLRNKGLAVDLSTDAPDAWHSLTEGRHDFCILNPVLPSMDGCVLATHIRDLPRDIPVVFMASPRQDSQAARIACFKAGADDFIVRPCAMEEILLRIRTIQKRFRFRSMEDDRIFNLGKLRFDHVRQRLFGQDCNIRLTTKEAELLFALCLNRGQVLERDKALLAVWKSAAQYNVRSMDVYISKLRRLLFQHTYSEILNIHGVGFKLLTHRDAAFRQVARRDAGQLRRRRVTGETGRGVQAASETDAETMPVTVVEPAAVTSAETVPMPSVDKERGADRSALAKPVSELAEVPAAVSADIPVQPTGRKARK